jgi:hypothetical protein
MKAFKYILIFIIGINKLSYSQVKNNGNISMENLPAVVIKSAGDDFSVYLPDRNADLKLEPLDSFIAY